jgi:hypothetical protein
VLLEAPDLLDSVAAHEHVGGARAAAFPSGWRASVASGSRPLAEAESTTTAVSSGCHPGAARTRSRSASRMLAHAQAAAQRRNSPWTVTTGGPRHSPHRFRGLAEFTAGAAEVRLVRPRPGRRCRVIAYTPASAAGRSGSIRHYVKSIGYNEINPAPPAVVDSPGGVATQASVSLGPGSCRLPPPAPRCVLPSL